MDYSIILTNIASKLSVYEAFKIASICGKQYPEFFQTILHHLHTYVKLMKLSSTAPYNCGVMPKSFSRYFEWHKDSPYFCEYKAANYALFYGDKELLENVINHSVQKMVNHEYIVYSDDVELFEYVVKNTIDYPYLRDQHPLTKLKHIMHKKITIFGVEYIYRTIINRGICRQRCRNIMSVLPFKIDPFLMLSYKWFSRPEVYTEHNLAKCITSGNKKIAQFLMNAGVNISGHVFATEDSKKWIDENLNIEIVDKESNIAHLCKLDEDSIKMLSCINSLVSFEVPQCLDENF